MTTNADIIRRAHRLMGLTRAGAMPQGEDAQDMFERWQSVLRELPGLGLNARWCEVAASAAYTAKEGERVTAAVGVTVTLPLTVTWCGATRPPKDLARVQVIGGTNPGLYVWVASRGAWSKLDGLTLNGDFPLGEEDVEGAAALLAVSMEDEFGDVATITDATRARSALFNRSIRSRLKAAEPKDWRRPDDSFRIVPGQPDPCDYY